MRLTAMYGGLFLLGGALLLTVTYLLVASHIDPNGVTVKRQAGTIAVSGGAGQLGPVPAGLRVQIGEGQTAQQVFTARVPSVKEMTKNIKFLQSVISAQRRHDLNLLLLGSGGALALMALGAVGLGWFAAGRVLAPLRTMTATTRQISAENLDARLALTGPDDELKELGDTIDGLLARLEHTFDAQRRFVANASHELRTPLTLERAMIEVALADPEADASSLREVCRRVLASGAEQERLIDALLTLARSQRGIDHREPVELDEVAADAMADVEHARATRTVSMSSHLTAAPITGDRRLVERLVANLVDNALRHNVPGGWMRVSTQVQNGFSTLLVANGGTIIDAGEVDSLLEPFRRLGPDRSAHSPGHGLGLSIVAAIAEVHGAELCAQARREGGLDVTVRFPRGAA
jgi:signal transduction histidine kinase